MRGRVQPALVVILAGVAAALHLTKLIPALPVLQQAMGLSLVQAGFLLSAVQMAGLFLGLLMGLAADSLGLRRSMLLGLATLSVASVAGIWATGAWPMMALRVVEGLGFLLAVTPAPGLIRRIVAPERLGKMLGVWSAYMPLATAMALLCGPLVMAYVGWHGLWALLAGLSGVFALWVWQVVPADVRPDKHFVPIATASPGTGTGTGTGTIAVLAITPTVPSAPSRAALSGGNALHRTLTHRGPWLVALCFAVYSFQWLAVIGFLPTVYAQAGVAVGTTAALTALAAAVNMVGNIASGRLLGSGYQPRHLLYAGYSVMGAAAVLAFADLPTSIAGEARFFLRFGGVLVFSMVGGIIPGTLFALAVKLAPDEHTVSTTIGWMQQWSALGQFAGPPVVALLASRVGGWQWTWLLTGACALVGAVLAHQVGRVVGVSRPVNAAA
jgi:MFS family permease